MVLRATGEQIARIAKRVLTSWHGGCTFIAYRKRTGAIPKAEGQQNADGSGVKPGLVGVQLCREYRHQRQPAIQPDVGMAADSESQVVRIGEPCVQRTGHLQLTPPNLPITLSHLPRGPLP